jgi:hypothetical protein
MAASTTNAPQMSAVDFYGRISFAGAMYVRPEASTTSRTTKLIQIGVVLSHTAQQRHWTCKLFFIRSDLKQFERFEAACKFRNKPGTITHTESHTVSRPVFSSTLLPTTVV